MATVIVIGDGPAGLSAALFLARNGMDTIVYAQDKTAMHYAELHNYLGVPEVGGTAFQQVARRQVTDHGAVIRDEAVAEVARDGERFTVRTEDGGTETADYLVLAVGKTGQRLADQLGLERGDRGVVIDPEARTSVDRVYAAGRLVRPDRSQAVISAGQGATAALTILAREAGKDVTDWDSPPEQAG
jgi:thioredoxin reductase (NADPH)